MNKIIITSAAPTPGNYNQAVLTDIGPGYLFECAGQTGNEAHGEERVIPGGIGPQTIQSLKNLRNVIKAAGGKLEDITKTTVFMTDLAQNKEEFEIEYIRFFTERGIEKDRLPARSTVGVSMIPLAIENTIVEIEARGYIPKKRD